MIDLELHHGSALKEDGVEGQKYGSSLVWPKKATLAEHVMKIGSEAIPVLTSRSTG